MIWTSAFWKGASERAIKTFAQTLAAYFVIGTTGLLEVDWVTALSVSGAAALASVLTSIGNADFTAGTPTTVTTVVNEVVADPFAGVTDGGDPFAGVTDEEDPFAGVDDEEDPFADVPVDDTEGGARID